MFVDNNKKQINKIPIQYKLVTAYQPVLGIDSEIIDGSVRFLLFLRQ